MTLNELKALSLEARKNNNKKAASLYQVVIGELERTTKDATSEQIYTVARKLIKAARVFPVPDREEIRLLESLLPVELSEEEIWAVVGKATSIKEAMALTPEGVEKGRVSCLWKTRNST